MTVRTEGPKTKRSLGFVVTLGALCAVSPLGIDMYVPGLPDLARSLGATTSAAQLSVTGFLLGLVVGQLLFGPLGDRFGRRPLLIGGALLAAACSAVCVFAPTIEVFDAARFLAGFFGATGPVLARSVVSDRFQGAQRGRYYAVLGVVVGVAPVVAPALGGAVVAWGSWRYVFVLLAVVSLALALSVARWVPESLPPERRTGGGVRASFAAMADLLHNRAFAGYILMMALTSAAMFTYVSDSSFVFEQYFGTGVELYTVLFAGNAVAMLIASSVFGALSGKVSPRALLGVGLAVTAVATIAHLVVTVATGGVFLASWLCLMGAVAGIGLIFPAITTIAQELGSASAGASSALLGAAQFALGALISPLAGLFQNGVLPMAAMMAVGAVLSGAVILGVRRGQRDRALGG
ncbi:Bcr/CflA family efflux MFS transporter [Kutzneria sp. NPDC052558]|uniref:Bcr/CflA family efflux MFS transporter n=1 Tax=Kutzneria sp. NPDC052558 TaxID=3364121 RepID=UPI0037C50A73